MSNKIVFTDEQIINIQKLLDNDTSISKISKIFNVSDAVISRIISDNNLHRNISNTEILRKKLPGYKELEENICMYYQSSKISMEELGNIFGLGICCIQRILKENNIERLKSYDFIRKYELDENYFSEIDSENKAYILGFFYADGNVGSSNYKVQIQLQEDDVEILNKMKEEFQLNRPLEYIKPPKKYPNRKPQYRLVIENKTFYNNIVKHGVIPRKSYLATFPYHIDKKYYKAFIRGVYDGDGCFTNEHISFTGTYELINAIGDIIDQELGIKKHIYVAQNSKTIDKNTRVLMFGGNNQVKKFLSWLYNDAQMYLKRKYDKYYNKYINDTLSN